MELKEKIKRNGKNQSKIALIFIRAMGKESELFSIRMEKFQFLILFFSLHVCHNTI